jgi:undecaprenyl pyrophosphate phosphatase UppP
MIVLKKYSIRTKKAAWRTNDFEKYRIDLMKNHLNQNGLYSEGKIILIKSMLAREMEAKKLPSLLAPGIVLAFIIPGWSEFVKYIYQNDINTTAEAWQYFYGLAAIVVIIVVLTNVFRFFYNEIKELIIRNDVAAIKYLMNLMENVHLQLPEKTNVEKG